MSVKNMLNTTKDIITGSHNYKHYKKYKTFDNGYVIAIKCVFFGILGLIIGVFINNIVIFLSNKLKIKNKLIQNIFQIVLCAIVVAVLHTSNKFLGWTLRNTIPGIFFIALIFNVQYKLADNIESTYIIRNDSRI
jgi:hypothetical protein